MDIATSAVSTVSSIFSQFWSFVTANSLIFILIGLSIVPVGIRLFMRLKSRLSK